MYGNTTALVYFGLYMTNWTIPNHKVITNVRSASECCMQTLSENSTSFFYNRDRQDCVVNQNSNFHTTNNLTEALGYRYYLENAPVCGPPPVIENAQLLNVLRDGEGDGVYTAYYTCPEERHFLTVSTSSCIGSTWSAGVECQDLDSCKAIKLCNPGYTTDGEYWMYPSGLNFQRARLYCKDMNTDNPTEYLTLNGENYAQFPRGKYSNKECDIVYGDHHEIGKTFFSKIRIFVQNMTVSRNDFSFTTTVYDAPVLYGNARACSVSYLTTCPLRGRAMLNISLTGLIFSSTTDWKKSGYAPVWRVVTRTDHEIYVTGDGLCGGSVPSGPIKFEFDSTYSPPLASATKPTCDIHEIENLDK